MTAPRLLPLLLWILPGVAAAQPVPARTLDVLHYSVQLTPDIQRRALAGRVDITVKALADGADALLLDVGALRIDRVGSSGAALSHTDVDGRLRVALPALRRGQQRRIRIDYHGRPRFGLEFAPARDEVYTVFSTSQWMPTVDAPDERATLDLSVRLPAGLLAAGTGRPMPSSDPTVHRWRLDTPMPSYVYGFAAGRYNAHESVVDGIALRALSMDRSPAELEAIVAGTGDMLRFFGERAGVPWRGTYTQVLVERTIGQELAGLSLLSEAYGAGVLADPSNIALIAHEAAHQWWGNLVTCRDWRHFWLNEGFANFMAAAWIERRFGGQAYARQVARWQARVERLRAEGKDRALVFPDWDAPGADDRAVVYQKGAYVLHLLRQELGEDAFWRGVRRYTRRHAGQAVDSTDLRRAMEHASRRDLGDFFAHWVDGT